MTTSLRDAVRKACDATPASKLYMESGGACSWPECPCILSRNTDLLTALIDHARAEERAECAKVADAFDSKDRDDNLGEWHTADYGIACRAVARAIRTRATCAPEPKEPKA